MIKVSFFHFSLVNKNSLMMKNMVNGQDKYNVKVIEIN